MKYKSLPFPIPDDIAADLCDPGSPPEGHVRVVFTKTSDTGTLVTEIRAGTSEDLTANYGESGAVEYRTDHMPKEALDMLPEWSP